MGEHLWVLKAIEHAEVYFNLLCAIDPKMLNKLSGSRETDDEIFADFTKSFPDLDVAKFSEDDIKSAKAKAEWREFCGRFQRRPEKEFQANASEVKAATG